MANNAQSRKWLMVINNPKQAGFDHDTIENKLKMFSPRYYCMSDEIASTGTEHTHIFLMSDSPIRFSTIKVVVSYLYGASGTGKTKSIYATHNATDICRITNYPRGGGIKFDAYNGQDVLTDVARTLF